jgi:hypothetical protein
MKIIISIQNKVEIKINNYFEKIQNLSDEIIFSKDVLSKNISKSIE